MANPRTIAKLEARIHERAAHALEFEVRDPRNVLVTITRVELSNDLSHAKIFYSVLGSKSERSKAEHMLASAGGFIQRQVARVLETRKVPHLHWIYDESIEQAQELDSAIRKALERDRIIAQTGKPPTDDEEIAPEAAEGDADLGDEELDEGDVDDVDTDEDDADADEDGDDEPEGDTPPGRA
ncbi:MAG: 30S ribosome-binding factor RbfA [Planctomycetota bacterium]|nr:30S ribosome-binding factor RbfA [Planctomycetota bacterium]